MFEEQSFTPAWLADPIHMAWLGDDIVVLNVVEDRYLCIVGGSALIQPGSKPGALRVVNTAFAEVSRAGLISTEPGSPRRASRPPQATLTLPEATRATSVFAAGLIAWRDGRRFSRLSLEQMVRTSDRQGWRIDSGQALAANVSAFLTALPWLPDQGQCLQRAFTLRCQLARRGLQVEWVFGVRTWPFRAHCWLQWGETVIADDLDRVRGFTPILVV